MSRSAPILPPPEVRLASPSAGGLPAAEHGLPLPYLLTWVRRRFWSLATFVIVVTAVTALVELALPKQYDAVALLRVDPQGSRVVGDSGPESSPVNATLLVTTEARIITSPAVIQQTMQDLHLADRPEFAAAASQAATESTADRDNRIARTMLKSIGIDQPAETFLLGVHYRAHNPQLAAEVANGLASAFLNHEYSTRARALLDSSKYMSDQLDGMRAQMETDQTKLVNYETQHDVIDPDDKSNIYRSRLTQINADLSGAQAERLKLEADYQLARSHDVDALMTSDRGKTLADLYAQELSDQRVMERMSSTYGPRYPLYLKQVALVAHDQAAISTEADHIVRQINAEYSVALLHERLIQAQLQKEKLAMDAFNLRAVRYESLKAAAESSTKLYYDLQQRIQDANVAAGLRSEDLRVISPAQVPVKPASPRPLLAALLAFLGSSALGLGAVAALALRDQTLTTAEQVELRFNLPALGCLPKFAARSGAELDVQRRDGFETSQTVGERRSPYAEAVLALCTSLQFASNADTSVLAVTSSVPGEGKSTACCHLAIAFALHGAKVLLVDADMRKPSVHRIFQVGNHAGLSSVLAGELGWREATQSSGRPGLTLLPCGPIPASPAEMLARGLPRLLEELRGQFDTILIDCPPALGLADAVAVASASGSVLLVVQAGATKIAQVAGAVRALRSVRANLLGIVLNRVSSELDEYYSYYQADYYVSGVDEDAEE